MNNTFKKFLAGLLACSLMAGAVPGDIGALELFTTAPVSASAATHTSGTVLLSSLKAGDYISNTVTKIVVSDDYDTYINFTVKLKANTYCTHYMGSDSYTLGRSDYTINTYFLTLYQGQISGHERFNGEYIYPVINGGLGNGWYVAAVDKGAKTITLSGEAPAAKTDISGAAVTVDPDTKTVKVSVGGKTLTSDDYDVEYIKQGETSGTGTYPTAPGTYTVKITGKGNYQGVVTKEITVGAAFTGVSLTLCDDIALNFFASGITSGNAADYTVKFQGNCVDSTAGFANKSGSYCATTHIYAKNMDEQITATIYDKNGHAVGKPMTCSVKDYLISPKHNSAGAKTKVLLKATELFGNASAEYFYGGDKSFTDSLTGYLSLTGQKESDLKTFATQSSFDFNAANAMISLVLDSKTAIRVYIKGIAPGTAAGGYVSHKNTKENSAEYPSYFEIGDLTPDLLAKQFTITVNGTSYTFSALSWANRVFRNGLPDSDKDMKMAKAVTAYCLAARSYVTASAT